MGRSPFTLAAAVTAALPGAEVTGARSLSADGDGRFDSAVASLADGRELAIRVADDDDAGRELAAEALALRALTDGARAMLPFRAPAYIGETRIGDASALVTELLPGFQIEAAMVPPGRGAAESMGASIAAVHELPTSVVRSAGLATRSAEESRADLERLVDTAAATGRVPARLTVRWREAVADDDLWRFESTVVLGGVQATSFLFDDDPSAARRSSAWSGGMDSPSETPRSISPGCLRRRTPRTTCIVPTPDRSIGRPTADWRCVRVCSPSWSSHAGSCMGTRCVERTSSTMRPRFSQRSLMDCAPTTSA
ncbi:hypothetical protein [Microbacterium sp. Se5.02b]|uniref:hypothetical protein n=1 Tax=Microbacterium sp. Se5.02b TaxID=2864103 RepID=UPI00215D86C9|nr:hypothetical protein [Microbacterium sp. Se5.02b]